MAIEIILTKKTITRTLDEKSIDNLGIVETPTGKVVAFENHPGQNTIVAGYFLRESKPEQEGVARRIEIQSSVPEELQDGVNKLLREKGYLGIFYYWQ